MDRGMDGLRCNRYPMMEDDQFSPLSFPPSDLPLTSLPTSCSESVTSRVQSQTFTLEFQIIKCQQRQHNFTKPDWRLSCFGREPVSIRRATDAVWLVGVGDSGLWGSHVFNVAKIRSFKGIPCFQTNFTICKATEFQGFGL